MKEKVGDFFSNEEQKKRCFSRTDTGEQYQEIIFPVLSPNPATDKNVHIIYPVHLTGDAGFTPLAKSNNTVYFRSWHYYQNCQVEDEDGKIRCVHPDRCR